MNALAIFISGDSEYADHVHVEETRAYAYFTGQNTGQDDHFVIEAVRRSIPVHVFYRKTGGTEFKYLGVSVNTIILDNGAGEGLMEASVECMYDRVIPCGRNDATRLAFKNGALDTIGMLGNKTI